MARLETSCKHAKARCIPTHRLPGDRRGSCLERVGFQVLFRRPPHEAGATRLVTRVLACLLLLVVVMMLHLAAILFAADRDGQFRLDALGFQLIVEVLVIRDEARGLTLRVSRLGRGGKLVLFALSLVPDVDRELLGLDRHRFLRGTVQNVDGHGPRRLVVQHLCVVLLVAQLDQIAAMRAVLGMRASSTFRLGVRFTALARPVARARVAAAAGQGEYERSRQSNKAMGCAKHEIFLSG